MDSYPAIEDHGLIGDLQTAALVATDGTIDWFCAPRFDSPSIFAALLDRRARAGTSGSLPTAPTTSRKQLYLPGTPILITRFLSADGVGELVDFMPIAGDEPPTGTAWCAWSGSCAADALPARVPAPRSTTAATTHEIEVTDDGVVFRSRHA